MGVKSTTEIVANGVTKGISTLFGEAKTITVLSDYSLTTGKVFVQDNSGGSTNLLTYTGLQSGTAFTVIIDENCMFLDDHGASVVFADLLAGQVLAGTDENFTVTSVTSEVNETSTYYVENSSAGDNFIVVPDSGLLIDTKGV
jgi:hypothetical protein